MLKVRFEQLTVMMPVIDNSGEHDAKISQEEFDGIHDTIERLEQLTGNRRRWPNFDPQYRQGSQSALSLREEFSRLESARQQIAQVGSGMVQLSKPDPPIDTRVRDSEMRSDMPEMSLEEFNERPERTKAPPRPRTNSWRHRE